jgi:hypothetical protein
VQICARDKVLAAAEAALRYELEFCVEFTGTKEDHILFNTLEHWTQCTEFALVDVLMSPVRSAGLVSWTTGAAIQWHHDSNR